MVEAAGGVNFKFSKVAISVNNFTSIGLNPFVDTRNVGLDTVAGVGGSGIDFSGVTSAKTDPAGQYLPARDTVIGAINAIGLGNLESLFCGSAACLDGVQGFSGTATATELANALVNQAVSANPDAAQLTEAANQLAA
jgi:hypothetical protein